MKDLLRIKKRWEDTGLLEGLNDDEKLKLSIHFEELLQLLPAIDTDHNFYYSGIFPILRRIYSQNKEFNVLHVAFDFKRFYESKAVHELINEYSKYPNVDIEAELCAFYAGIYRLDKTRFENENK
jgi:hypothetical protein